VFESKWVFEIGDRVQLQQVLMNPVLMLLNPCKLSPIDRRHSQLAPENTPEIPIGLPADLLERRPDIVEADRNVAAATAQIGVAKAAYFPRLSLAWPVMNARTPRVC